MYHSNCSLNKTNTKNIEGEIGWKNITSSKNETIKIPEIPKKLTMSTKKSNIWLLKVYTTKNEINNNKIIPNLLIFLLLFFRNFKLIFLIRIKLYSFVLLYCEV